MKEPNGYRQTVEMLNEKTGGKMWLTATEIARVLGVDRKTVKSRFGIVGGCALPVLAMILAKESEVE